MNTGQKRKEKIHTKITASAIKIFSRQGIRHTSLDEIAKEADVARRTLYNHFKSKEDIIVHITRPILSTCFRLLDALPPDCRLEDLISFCFDLWEIHKEDLNIIHLVEIEEIGPLKDSLQNFIFRFIQLFQDCSERCILYHKKPAKSALLVYKVFLPVLRSLEEEENRQEKFIRMMMRLISPGTGTPGLN